MRRAALPRNLVAAAESEGRQEWLVTTLPRVIGESQRMWSLTLGEPFQPGGATACLQIMCQQWADEFAAKAQTSAGRVDPGLVRTGIELFRELPATAPDQVLLCTDLHADNVLAAQREQWLAIDPKPYVGDPAYDPLQHMLNCSERLRADPHGLARRMAGLLDLNPERVLLWLFARCVQESPDWPSLAEVARRDAPA